MHHVIANPLVQRIEHVAMPLVAVAHHKPDAPASMTVKCSDVQRRAVARLEHPRPQQHDARVHIVERLSWPMSWCSSVEKLAMARNC